MFASDLQPGWMDHMALGRHFFADGGAADCAGGLGGAVGVTGGMDR